MSTLQAGDDYLWRHANELNNKAKQYPQSGDPWSFAENIKKQLTRHNWEYEIRDGRIIWLSTNTIDKDCVKELTDTYNGQRFIHINTGTHGDKNGNIITLYENAKYYRDCTQFIREDMLINFQWYNVSIHFVTSYSPPFYPEYDVVDAWCFSENQFERHLGVAEYVAEIINGNKRVPSPEVIRHVGDKSVDVLRPETLKECLDSGDMVQKVGIHFKFTQLQLLKLQKYCAGGGRPVVKFGETLAERGTDIKKLQNICEDDEYLWRAAKVMENIAAKYQHPKTMFDVDRKYIEELCNCLDDNSLNPVQKNWKHVADKLCWEPKDIKAISDTVRDKDTYSPTAGLISILTSMKKTVNDFLNGLEEINQKDGTYTKTIHYVKEIITELEQQEEARRRKKEEKNKAEEKARRRKKEEKNKAEEEARRKEEEQRKAEEEARRRKKEEKNKAEEEARRRKKEEKNKAEEKAKNDKRRTMNIKRICIAISIVIPISAILIGLYNSI